MSMSIVSFLCRHVLAREFAWMSTEGQLSHAYELRLIPTMDS